MRTAKLFEEYRGGILECVHSGMVAVVDEKGPVVSLGDADFMCYYRSCSKPIQSLPVILRKLDEKYGLTEEETAMLSASHFGDAYHIRLLESIMEKTGLSEAQLIMRPVYPDREKERISLLKRGFPPRKLYHCCSGKHLGMMLLSRELGEDVEDYWRPESRTQEEILQVLSKMTDVPAGEIRMGLDGCGVPVYAVPFQKIAVSFLRLQCPDLIEDERLKEAVERNVGMIHKYPNTIAGENVICSILSKDPDILAKSGAAGIYAMGIKSRRIGIVAKVLDGTHDVYGQLARHILLRLGYDTDAVKEIERHYPDTIFNSNGQPAGERRAVFSFSGI